MVLVALAFSCGLGAVVEVAIIGSAVNEAVIGPLVQIHPLA